MVQIEETFDPYRKWLGIPTKEQPPNHYRLLGIELFESDPDVIEAAADQRIQFVRTCASGRYSELSQEVLNELSEARVVLLNSEQKCFYDAGLRAETDARANLIDRPPRSARPFTATKFVAVVVCLFAIWEIVNYLSQPTDSNVSDQRISQSKNNQTKRTGVKLKSRREEARTTAKRTKKSTGIELVPIGVPIGKVDRDPNEKRKATTEPKPPTVEKKRDGIETTKRIDLKNIRRPPSKNKSVPVNWTHNLVDAKPIHTFPSGGGEVKLAFLPKQNRLAVWGWRSSTERPSVLLLNPSSGRIHKNILTTNRGIAVEVVRFSPDGSAMIVGEYTLELWSPSAGKRKETLVGYKERKRIRSAVFSMDRRLLATVGTLDEFEYPLGIKVWNARTGRIVQTIDLGSSDIYWYPLAIDPVGKAVVSIHKNHLKLWDIETGIARKDFGEVQLPTASHEQSIVLEFDEAGKRIIYGATNYRNSEIGVWSIATSKMEFSMRNGSVAKFHPQHGRKNGGLFVVGKSDGTIRKVALNTLIPRTLAGRHSGAVRDIAISHSGELVASASEDWTFKVWNIQTDMLLATVKGHSNKISYIDFSFDDRKIATSSEDGTVKIWDLEKILSGLKPQDVKTKSTNSKQKSDGDTEKELPFAFEVPKSGNAVTKGSFTTWTVPEKPVPGESYRIVIQVTLPNEITQYRSSDLSGKVIGTDSYTQIIPYDRRKPNSVKTTQNGQLVVVRKDDFLPVKNRITQIVIEVPGATELIKDTIQIESKLLQENQTLVRQF